jgi:hypothetical protein
MIGFKSALLNATLAVTAAIPLATAGLFTSASSAQAAALTGSFQLSSGLTTGEISSNSIKFSSFFDPKFVFLPDGSQKTESFTNFYFAKINNILSFSPVDVNNPFLDLGTNTTTITDNKNIFKVTSIGSLALTNTTDATNKTGTSISIGLSGIFVGDNPNDISKGSGGLAFFLQGIDAATLQASLDKGETVSGLSFTGGYLATVPEPTTVIGLGLVGAGMVMSRRRKSVAQ